MLKYGIQFTARYQFIRIIILAKLTDGVLEYNSMHFYFTSSCTRAVAFSSSFVHLHTSYIYFNDIYLAQNPISKGPQ